MKVFLSWSGAKSHGVAQALRDWIPLVLQSIQPWLSSSDIQAGTRWADELAIQLANSRFGIICLTPENLAAPWMLFEAGALSKQFETAFVCPYLFGFMPSDLHGPLTQYQALVADKNGTLALVKTLNRALGENSINENNLERTFIAWWPELEKQFAALTIDSRSGIAETKSSLTPDSVTTAPQTRQSVDQLVEEVLAIVRGQEPAQMKGAAELSQDESQQFPKAKQRVFIIHGRDHGIREQVARFIEQLGLAAIILDEQPSAGRTIIEKVEMLTDVDYAIALMTGDDVGGLRNAPVELQGRARQNVVFEMGFFSAKLGRSRITVLHEDGIEIPSDFSGILYITLDAAGAWKFQLARELKTAGLSVDLNRAL